MISTDNGFFNLRQKNIILVENHSFLIARQADLFRRVNSWNKVISKFCLQYARTDALLQIVLFHELYVKTKECLLVMLESSSACFYLFTNNLFSINIFQVNVYSVLLLSKTEKNRGFNRIPKQHKTLTADLTVEKYLFLLTNFTAGSYNPI